MHNGWMYQGRQSHMWFGHGTKPVDGSAAADAKPDLGSIDERIHNLGHTLVAGLPASKRHHSAARLGRVDKADPLPDCGELGEAEEAAAV